MDKEQPLVEQPHVFTGRVVNGTAICKFCSATPLEAAYALGPTCKQPINPELIAAQAENAKLREALTEIAVVGDRTARAIADKALEDREIG